MALLDRAPHPAVAKIFINWLLTREGQTILSQAQGSPSTRIDVTTAGLDPSIVLKPGNKYFESDTEKSSLEQAEHLERAKKLFASLLQ